jgi:hypothetical protein
MWFLLVIIDDLNVVGVAAGPAEADSPLVVDSDAVLAQSIAGELLQSIGGWNAQVEQTGGGVEEHELSQGDALKIGGEPADLLPFEEALRVAVAEAPNHNQ